MNYQSIYHEVALKVLMYRAELERDWPTPPAGDCLKFATTEAGEVIEDKLPTFEECLMWAAVKATRVVDAELRQNPMYARNNDKDIDPLDEVADCLMMLVSANQQLGYLYVNTHNFGYLDSTYTKLANECTSVLGKYEEGGSISLHRPVTICLQLLGEDAPKRVESRLQRIKAKALERKRMTIDSPVTLAAKRCPEIQNLLTMIEMGTMTESDALKELMIKYAALKESAFLYAIESKEILS